jgi:hypothetical protein
MPGQCMPRIIQKGAHVHQLAICNKTGWRMEAF